LIDFVTHLHSFQLLSCQPTGLVIAAHEIQLAERIAKLLNNDSRIRCWVTDDVVGVEVGGALKNIYAIGSGLVEGAGFGYNPTALLITRGCNEIRKLAVALGAKPSTLAGLSGIGDLMLTAFGPASRNRSVGVRVRLLYGLCSRPNLLRYSTFENSDQIGKGETLDEVIASMSEVAEGVPTILAGVKLAKKLNIELPLLGAIHAAVYERLPMAAILDRLMQMPVTIED
jgi:glycerol-3-phosphate dehydrogenase